MTTRGERRLAAIMYTDMVGYTSLTQKNESLALELIEEQRKLVRKILPRHRGREVKTIGDAFLVEFPSALDAAKCSYGIQRSIREFNSILSEDRKLHLRIGVHVGDILVEPMGDISGDAVNVASRIESLAEDGGVCLTRQVYDQVHNKFELPLESIGVRQLKNVVFPIEVFKIVMPWNPASTQAASSPASPMLDATKRIAVLPFTNISANPADEFFSDGMTEEVIATMSRISGLRVIARTSVMGYKSSQKKISEIAKELEVGAVLEGSVRRVGDRARITVQLIDSATSEHLWAESYDREIKDVFAIQSDISKTVADALRVQLLTRERAEMERKPEVNAEAYTLYLKGRYYWNERTKNNVENAIKYFEASLKEDPKFALSYSGLADCYVVLANYAWMVPASAAPLAQKFASRALELDDSLAEAHASLGTTLAENFWDFGKAERELTHAIELRPNYAPAIHWYSLLLGYVSRPQEALIQEKKALEIDPLSRLIRMGIAVCLMDLGRYQESLDILERLVEEFPDHSTAHFWKSCLHVFLGEIDSAINEAKKALDLEQSRFMMLNLAWVSAEAGLRERAKEILDQVLQSRSQADDYVRPGIVALVYLSLGDYEEAFKWLEIGIDEKDTAVLRIRSFPWLQEKYFSDARFAKIWERIASNYRG